MATNDGGAGPTDFSGVTYLGKPNENSSGSYHIKRSSGKVLGPFDADLIVQMIRGDKLSGDEGVSTDAVTWIPILAVPQFGDAFQGAGRTNDTLFGVQAIDTTLRSSPSGEEATVVTDRDSIGFDAAMDAAAPPAPAAPMFPPRPLEESGLGVTEDSTMTLASGSWAAMDDDELTEQSLSAMIAPTTGGVDMLSGVRQLSGGSASTDLGVGSTGEPLHSTTELPTPRGFTHFPGGPQELPVFPSDDELLAGLSEGAGHSADDAPEPLGLRDLPSGSPSGLSGTDPTLPTSAGGTNLPISAEGTNLPRSAEGTNLPRSADGTNLPRSAGGTNLPISAGRAGLPASTGRSNLPTSANPPELPNPFSAPQAGAAPGGSQFGTMAMSGIGEAELPASRHQFDLGEYADDAGGGIELPASSHGGGASLLDEMAEADDIWAAPEEPVALDGGNRSFGARPAPATSYATEEIGIDISDARGIAEAFAPTSPSTDEVEPTGFEDFFPEGEAAAAPREQPSSLTELAQAQQPSSAARTKSGGGGAKKALIGVAAVALIGGGAWFAMTQLGGGGAEEPIEVVQAAPVAPAPVRAVEVAGVEALYTGAYNDYVLFFGDARTAVDQRATNDDRAKLVIAGALLRAEHPASAQAASDLAEQVTRLRGVQEPTPLVTLAIGAWEAVTGDEAAPDTLRPLFRGEFGGVAQLFAGLSNVQRYRGERPPAPEAVAVAAPVAAAGDGSGEGSAEPAAAVAEAPAPTEEEIAVLEESVPLDAATGRVFAAAATAQPDLVSAYYWQGWVALELGDAEAAQSAFEAALERNATHVPSHVGVARSLLGQGRLADADARILQVIDEGDGQSSAEQRADAFVAGAEVAIARLQPEVAIESLLSALQADPTNGDALQMLGEQFYRAGQFARAIEYFQTNADVAEDDPNGVLGLAQAQMGLDMLDEAQTTLESAMDRFPRDARFPYQLGQVFERKAEFELSRQFYRQSLQIEPANGLAYVALARLAERENLPGDALALLLEADRTGAESASMSNEIGEMYLRLGERNRAVTAFNRALELEQSHPDARINLTEYYLNTGQDARAITFIDSMVAAGIDSPRLRFLNARALHGKGEYERGIEEMLTLLEGDPVNAEYLFMLGRLQFDAGNFEAARVQFAKAFEAEPRMDAALYYVGRSDRELGNVNDAIASLTAVSQRNVRGEYFYWLGVALENGFQAPQAMDAYGQAIELDIAWSLENPDVFYRRGALLYERGFGAAAYRDLRTSATLNPMDAGSSALLGRVYYDDREYDAAIASFLRSLELEPGQAGVHYRLGLAYLRLTPQQLEPARMHLEAAREGGFGETRPDVYQRLAYVYRDLGQYGSAADTLQAYLDSSANLPYDERRETENEVGRLRGRR